MIVITSDHSGMILKNEIKEYLKMEKIEFVDLGPDKFIKNDDYPDFVPGLLLFIDCIVFICNLNSVVFKFYFSVLCCS